MGGQPVSPGQQAIAQQGNIASNIGQFGQQSSANIANLLAAKGQAQASGILGKQQVKSQFVDQLISGAGMIAGFA